MAYRALLLHNATRDCCNQACKAANYTTAQTVASAQFNKDISPFSGISGTEQLVILIKPLAGGTATISTTKLSPNSVNPSSYVYFYKSIVTGQIAPLTWFTSGWMGLNIPGLTGPYSITITSESYVENPNGLTQ